MLKTIFVTPNLTDTSSTDLEGVGCIRDDQYGNIYKWVKNTHSTTSTIYGACVYDGDARTQVTIPATASLLNHAGFWKAAVKTGEYGWIQCKGKGTGILAASSIARSVGMALIPMNAAETLDSIALSFASNVSVVAGHQMVRTMSSAASASVTSTIVVLFDCML